MKLKEYMSAKRLISQADKLLEFIPSKKGEGRRKAKNGYSKKQSKNRNHDS